VIPSWMQAAAIEFEMAHAPRPFVPGETPIPPSGKVIGGSEIQNAMFALMDNVLTEGPWVARFEEMLASRVGVKHASMCNSGSSANLLAVSALKSHWLHPERRLHDGDVVVTTAVGFPTTLNAILHARLRPVFIDVELETLVPADDNILGAVHKFDARAVVLAHTLGNPWPLSVVDLLDVMDVYVIEDNCDALGSLYQGRMTGGFGTLATQSFYPAHHITTGEGGAVLTNSQTLKRAVESLRDWGRDCWCPPGKDNTCGKRFEWRFADGSLPEGYDHKYVYSEVGYNLKSTDLQAAIGVAQLDRLGGFTRARRERFDHLFSGLRDLSDYFILPQETAGSRPSWFGFPLTCTERIRRSDVLALLAERKIGTRNLFGGNLLRQPAYHGMFEADGRLPNSDIITERTFWIGCWPGLTPDMLNFIVEALHDACKNR